MLKKGWKINSILRGTCPRCHQESMYCSKNLFNLSTLLKTNNKCSHCKLQYQIEPSFFYGAMYVSYGINVALMVGVFLICFFGFNAGVGNISLVIIISLLLLFPYIMRLSRNIYINIFVSYDEHAVKNNFYSRVTTKLDEK